MAVGKKGEKHVQKKIQTAEEVHTKVADAHTSKQKADVSPWGKWAKTRKRAQS